MEVEGAQRQEKGQSYGQLVWRQFCRNRLSLGALGIIGLLALVAAGADLLAGDKPYYLEYEGKTYRCSLGCTYLCS